MFLRPIATILLAVPLLFPESEAAALSSDAPAQVVVRNDTYSSLQIALVDEAGKETALGQAPPDFSNTLVVKEPLPTGAVRLVARLVGEREPLYRSETVRLRSGTRVKWLLPDNRVER